MSNKEINLGGKPDEETGISPLPSKKSFYKKIEDENKNKGCFRKIKNLFCKAYELMYCFVMSMFPSWSAEMHNNYQRITEQSK